jgi:uncharacterized protein YndB with AHSA1/START domain
MQFSTRTTIAAPAETVWAILTDLPAWPSWNSTVTATDGAVALGSKVTVSVTANPGRSFPVKVTSLDAPTRMVWTGGMPLGLFTGTRTYSLARDDGHTQFAMDEVYAGPLAGMVTRSIPDLQPSFDEFAACLKAAAESIAQAAS